MSAASVQPSLLDGLPALPTDLTRWAVDRHYTALVDHLRRGGDPSEVSEVAKRALLAQFRAAHPSDTVPEYMARLGAESTESNEGDRT